MSFEIGFSLDNEDGDQLIGLFQSARSAESIANDWAAPENRMASTDACDSQSSCYIDWIQSVGHLQSDFIRTDIPLGDALIDLNDGRRFQPTPSLTEYTAAKSVHPYDVPADESTGKSDGEDGEEEYFPDSIEVEDDDETASAEPNCSHANLLTCFAALAHSSCDVGRQVEAPSSEAVS